MTSATAPTRALVVPRIDLTSQLIDGLSCTASRQTTNRIFTFHTRSEGLSDEDQLADLLAALQRSSASGYRSNGSEAATGTSPSRLRPPDGLGEVRAIVHRGSDHLELPPEQGRKREVHRSSGRRPVRDQPPALGEEPSDRSKVAVPTLSITTSTPRPPSRRGPLVVGCRRVEGGDGALIRRPRAAASPAMSRTPGPQALSPRGTRPRRCRRPRRPPAPDRPFRSAARAIRTAEDTTRPNEPARSQEGPRACAPRSSRERPRTRRGCPSGARR